MKKGHFFRPFSISAKIKNKAYSFHLQKIMTDFGLDISFEEASKKIKYHYRIEVSSNAIRKVTEKHAKQISNISKKTPNEKAKQLIVEMDGTMVPIVEIMKGKGDKRKKRTTCWKEAKLCFAKRFGSLDKIYGGVIGSPEEAGNKLYQCSIQAGLNNFSKIHGVGDGAGWIVDQMDAKFGSQANFLIDFYHLCEYLSEASTWGNPLNPKKWFLEQKEKLKLGKKNEIIENIKTKIDKLGDLKKDNPLVKCYNYMKKRMKYFDYKKAIDNGLPIGSGEIESSHRHVIQKRLKIAGAWWKKDNANAMINMRIARLNGCLEDYWDVEMIKRRAA